MLETLRTAHPHVDRSTNCSKGQRGQSLYLLQRHARELMEEYQSALLEFDKDEKKVNDIQGKLKGVFDKLSSEKAKLQKSTDDLCLTQQRAEWDNLQLQKELASQQEQLNLLREEKEAKQEKQSSLRESNLKLLTEQQKIHNHNANFEESNKGQSLKEQDLQRAIQKIRKNICEKKASIQYISQNIQKKEQQNEQLLRLVQHNEQIIEDNTIKIEKALRTQRNLTNCWLQMKRVKKDMNNKAKEVVVELRQGQDDTERLIQIEQALLHTLHQVQHKQEQARMEIGQLISARSHEQAKFLYNKDCLAKLTSHLQTLKAQNQRIQQCMENVVQQDWRVKAVIERKYQRKGMESTGSTMW